MKPNIARVALIVGLILLIPFFGNLYVEGWNWSPFDFVVMGTLLFVVGLAIDFTARKVTDPVNKVLAIGAIVLAFLALWTEMAVGAVSQLLDFIF
jgi:hypothetical protein